MRERAMRDCRREPQMATVTLRTTLTDGCWNKNFQNSMIVILPKVGKYWVRSMIANGIEVDQKYLLLIEY